MSVESNARLLGFCFNLSYDWPETQAIHSTNQKQNENRSRFGYPRLPALFAVKLVLL